MENRPDYPALRVGDLQVIGEVVKPVGEDTYLPAGYDTYLYVRRGAARCFLSCDSEKVCCTSALYVFCRFHMYYEAFII